MGVGGLLHGRSAGHLVLFAWDRCSTWRVHAHALVCSTRRAGASTWL